MSKRYYLHGDKIENEPNKYYCDYCDEDVTLTHFAKECRCPGTAKDNDYTRYQRNLKSWKETLKDYKQRGVVPQYHRPENAKNYFA